MASRNVDEYLVCVPKQGSKKYNVMRFNASDNVDIRNWISGTLARDMSAKKIYEDEEVYPEFGEGSEYGKKQREEARRLKYGIKRSKFKEEDQPWNLGITTIDNSADMKKKVNGKNDIKPNLITREYSGKKEGGIGEGSTYFIFTQRPDFTFEAHPVEDWFNFKRKTTHRTLTDEEAEAAWEKRDKIVNHLNYMARKRLHINDDDEEGGEESATTTKIKQGSVKEKDRDFMLHDNEDYSMYMSDSASDVDDTDASDNEHKKRKTSKKSKPTEDEDVPDRGEDSDDGEHEGTEIAYASDVSSENEETNDSKVAPRGLDEISSSSSSDEEEPNKDKIDPTTTDLKTDKSKGSDDSSDSGDSDSDIDNDDSISKSALFMLKNKNSPKEKKKENRPSSRSSTPITDLPGSSRGIAEQTKKFDDKGRSSPYGSSSGLLGKRHAPGSGDEMASKQLKFSQGGSRTSTPTRDLLQQGISEEAVRRYLTLKPITTKDLLKKFKPKKTGLSSEKIVEKVANILKKLNPEQSKINGKIHLFLKIT